MDGTLDVKFFEVLALVLVGLLLAVIIVGVALVYANRCQSCKSFRVFWRRRDGKRWCGHGHDHPMEPHVDLDCMDCGNSWYVLRSEHGKSFSKN